MGTKKVAKFLPLDIHVLAACLVDEPSDVFPIVEA